MDRMFIVAFLLVSVACSASPDDPASFVDPFIGTAKGGNTFPGAVRPWGMVSVSPHNNLSAPSGYVAGGTWFYGLGHVHLSGTGCADLGSIILLATRGPVRTTPEKYRTRLSQESATPGYYAATLPDEGIRIEATSTDRCGIIRLTSLADGEITILLDAGRSLALVGGGAVRFVDDTLVTGYNIGGGFCGEANRHRVHFALHLSTRPNRRGVWKGDAISASPVAEAVETSVGGWIVLRMRAGEQILLRTGISYFSEKNAFLNLTAEALGRPFDSLKTEARDAWNTVLGRVRIDGGERTDRTTFATALYHSLIHPNLSSDVRADELGRRRYSVFSLWDTYRTVHPLLALLFPERQADMVRTMLEHYRNTGWLPKWELAGNETFMMVGDPAVPVIADTYLKGIRGYDTALAYAAVTKAATHVGADAARPGYVDQLSLGFIPYDQDTTQQWWVWGPVSSTLEYCYADWCISKMAERMGHKEDAAEFRRRSLLYRNLFDHETAFLRPRKRDGTWLVPFDPAATEGSASWSGSGGPGYVEGNAWNYTWFVPHDIDGLIRLFGSPDSFSSRLERCFADSQFTMTNEPDIAYPYLFTYTPEQEHRTGVIITDLRRRWFRPDSAGLPGNDDAGTISAWYVFSALGLYPACPGSNEYRLGRPLFERLSFPVFDPQGRSATVVIEKKRRDPADHHDTLLWNGVRLSHYAIPHEELTSGGTLTFVVDDR